MFNNQLTDQPSFRKRAYFAKQNVSPLSGIQLFFRRFTVSKPGFHVAGKPFASRAAKGKALAWNDGALSVCRAVGGCTLLSCKESFNSFGEVDR